MSLTTEQKIQRARESGRKGGLATKALREATHVGATRRIVYFEGAVHRAAAQLHAVPKNASGAIRLLAKNRYAYAVRCHQEAIAGRKWLPRPPENV